MPKMVTTDDHPNYKAGVEIYVAQHLAREYMDRGWVKEAGAPQRKPRKKKDAEG